MAFGGIPDDRWFQQLNKQLQAVNRVVNLNVIGTAQQVVNSYGPQLAQVEAMVHAMRVSSSYVSTLQATAQLQGAFSAQLAATVTPALDMISVAGQSAALRAAQLLSSLPAYVFENLREAQEAWFQTIRFSGEFLRLQHLLGTDLAQLLSEYADRYRAGLDGRDAFALAFGICYEELLFSAIRILHNFHDAEDALQDASERALRALPTYSPEQIRCLNVRAWFLTIVQNTAKNSLRNRYRCTPYEASWMEQRPGSRIDQPETSLLRRELFQAVCEAFRALPELQHKIIFLRYFGAEVKWEGLAKYLGYPSSAVRTYYTRGLKTLRKQLEGLQFSAADLAEVMEAFSPGFPQHNGSGWLGEIGEE